MVPNFLRRKRILHRVMSSLGRVIQLTSTETEFIKHLEAFSRTKSVECRIAGGWVRDKLLGLPSHDLDIALTIPSGYLFATEFVDYLHQKKISTGSVGRVAANPKQSKHLETGTTRIMGLECDFVGLRSETYADSRIPDQIRLGTPLEDASRRDLTINALFYNVSTRAIEDFTRHGLSDLESRIARTPLAPDQTFQDDPLRMLRCIRFASRFGLTVTNEVAVALQSTANKNALKAKVSKERIGIEVHKMMQHDPFRALSLIESFSLHSSIFTASIDPPRTSAIAVAGILRAAGDVFPLDEILWLAAANSPFRDLVIKGKKDLPAVSVVLSEGLKLSNEIKTSVTNLFTSERLLVPQIRSRSTLGRILQLPSVRPWQRSLTWNAVIAVLDGQNAQQAFDSYQRLRQHIFESGLAADIEKAPLLNGKEVQARLSLPPSPLIQLIMEKIIEWQLDHPEAIKTDCEQWLDQLWSGPSRSVWESEASQRNKPTKGEKRKR